MLLVFDLSGTLLDANGQLYADGRLFLEAAKQQGYSLAIATNLGRQGMLTHLREVAIEHQFDSLQCAGIHPFKPAPDMLQQALLETGHEPTEAIMIGDSLGDMQMAKAAGVKCCAALWGEGRYDALIPAKPDFIAESFVELSNLIGMNFEKQSDQI